jgi:TonB family protein
VISAPAAEHLPYAPAASGDAPPTIKAARPAAPAVARRPRARTLLAQTESSPPNPAAAPGENAAATPQDAGSLSGTAEDATGARVPQATVILRDPNNGAIQTTTTNPAGVYRFPSIPPGRYDLDYSAPGFASRTNRADVQPGKPARVDALLEVGQVSEVVIAVAAPRPAGAAPPSAAPSAPVHHVVAVGGRVQACRLLKNPQPVYPPGLRDRGIEGTVVLRARISREGVPVNPHVLNGDEVDPGLAQAALDAVRQWRYEPSQLDGEPVETTTTIEVDFHLRN